MASRIGSDIHRARARREVDLSEVEAATRIRERFLSAIENEEWEALPGGVYTRGFIRTYASYLGLDGDRLADDYRRDVEGEGEARTAESVAPAAPKAGAERDGRRGPRIGWIALAVVAAIAAIAVFAIPDRGEDRTAAPSADGAAAVGGQQKERAATPRRSGGISMKLAANAEVWVCLLDAAGRRLVDGQILAPGDEKGPFHSASFTVSFGNGEVTMLIDGERAQVPTTSSPIGYSVGSSGRLRQLSEAQRPTCT
jgi:cytoskeleton protein RodZ